VKDTVSAASSSRLAMRQGRHTVSGLTPARWYRPASAAISVTAKSQ
jgi:hypothetical protein